MFLKMSSTHSKNGFSKSESDAKNHKVVLCKCSSSLTITKLVKCLQKIILHRKSIVYTRRALRNEIMSLKKLDNKRRTTLFLRQILRNSHFLK